MIAIIVATPLQLFNSMMIMRHHFQKERCDLFVLSFACDMHPYVENYKSNTNFIDSVYFVERFAKHQSCYKKFLSIFYNFEHKRDELSGAFDKTYEHLFTTWVGVSSSWLYSKLAKKNPQMHLHFYEEGVGIYISSIYIRPQLLKLIFRSFGNRLDEDNIEDIYMYRPELCTEINSSLPRIPIGNFIESDRTFIKKLNRGINVQPYRSKVLYFESTYLEVAEKRGIDEAVILERISKIVGVDNIIVRTHPRSNPQYYRDKGYYIDENLGINWELALSQGVVTNDTILVALDSTALFTPNFIYRLEPRVVFIGKCVQNEKKDFTGNTNMSPTPFDILCHNLMSSYKDKSRVMVPESFTEFTNILKSF